MAGLQLPPYPTTQKIGSLIVVQSTLQRCVSSTAQYDIEIYLATYAKHRAYSTLQTIVWHTDTKIPEEITQLTLLIAQRSTRTIAIHTLIDLSIVYAHSPYLEQLQQLFQAQYSLYPLPLTGSITNDAVPTFTSLLANSDAHQALASKCKISESLVSFLHACSPISALVRPFSISKDFVLALAFLYTPGLASIARSYGGYHALLSLTTNEADDWPHIWIQTKIALIDSFHIVLTALLDGPLGEAEKEHIFETLFALLDIGVAPPSTTPSTPFLDLPLIADYHHAYNLLDKLPSIFNENISERDPRLDLLESSLFSLLSGVEKKNSGVLKVVLHSKAKTKSWVKSDPILLPIPSTSNDESTAFLESKTAQILTIFPQLSPSHVTRLLQDDRFRGNVEHILEGLLDGSLVSECGDVDEEGLREEGSRKGKQKGKSEDREKRDAFAYDVAQRRNIFDNEELDIARVRVGKQDIKSHLLQDRTTIERMKWDILRRAEEMEEAEAMSLEEDEDNRKLRPDTACDEDEIAVGVSRIHLLGDEESDADSFNDSGTEGEPLDPEAVIEQAYLHDPSVFDRDANTRRGKARMELRNLTGWADEQIEGWKVILERMPGKKAKLEEKHAFSGNVKGLEVHVPGPNRSSGYGGRGRGRTRGVVTGDSGGESSRGFRRGGRWGRGGGGSNRKRGYDKKIAKAGGIG